MNYSDEIFVEMPADPLKVKENFPYDQWLMISGFNDNFDSYIVDYTGQLYKSSAGMQVEKTILEVSTSIRAKGENMEQAFMLHFKNGKLNKIKEE